MKYLKKPPHIFVFTEFVKAVGWIDLKTILEEKYDVFDSPYLVHQNGICIGIRKDCGIEYLETETKSAIFNSCLNSPDFYEIKVKINSKITSVIGTRIRIDFGKANSKRSEVRIAEYKQRFEQYSQLIEYIARLENVIVLGDFNNSRILSDEAETNERIIDKIYTGKDSIEYNFQKMRAFVIKKADGKFSLNTADGDRSSVGAFWDSLEKKAKAPILNKSAKHKYDHILTNFCPQKIEYNWDFLKFYNSKHFTSDGKIVVGYPDHAILLAEILL